jgi:hypothetical protein
MLEPNRSRPFIGVVTLLVATLAAQAKVPPKGNVRLFGRVVNVLHEGVPAAEVWVTDRDGTSLGRTVADGDGYFQLHRLPSAAAELHATGERRVQGRMPIEAQGLVRAATLVLEDGDPVHGTLRLADGTPAAHAAVLVTTRHRLEPPFDWVAETTTDANGKWSLPSAPLRPLLLRAFTPGRPVLEEPLERGAVGANIHTFAAATTQARRVVVRGAAAGTTVTVYCDTFVPYSTVSTRWPTAVAEVRCDANGEALLWPLPIPTEARVRAAGHGSMPIAIPLRDGKHPVLEFTLTPVPAEVAAPSTRVRGRLVDALGQPLANIEVVGREDNRIGPPTTTGADGTFELDLPARPGVLCHVAVRSRDHVLVGRDMETTPDGLLWQRLRTEPDKVLDLEALDAGSIVATLRQPNGTPFAAARVQIDVPPGTLESATDAGGRVEVHGLPAGTHTMLVTTPTLRAKCKVTAIAGRPGDVGPLEFEPGGEVFGVVVDGTGRPLPGMSVLGMVREGRLMARALQALRTNTMTGQVQTDRNGRFRIPHLHAGTWNLFASDPDHTGVKRPSIATLEIENGGRSELSLQGER